MMTLAAPRRFVAGGAIVPLAVLALAACNTGGGTSSASPQLPKTSTGTAATLSVAKTSLGSILVDAQGHTLYLFQKDPGDTTGQGVVAFGAGWFALSPSGSQVSGSTSTTGGGSGLGY